MNAFLNFLILGQCGADYSIVRLKAALLGDLQTKNRLLNKKNLLPGYET
jgi:hypothetical protein